MNPTASSHRFEVFLDESGTFTETSHDPVERSASRQSFPSQLAGVLAPAGLVTKTSATRVLTEAFGAAGLEFKGTSHANELRKGQPFDSVVSQLAAALGTRGWTPFRIVNTEGVSFGNRVANYTNHVAELCLRIFENLRAKGLKDAELALTCARVKLGEDSDGMNEMLEKPDYVQAIQAAMMRAAIRAGRAADAKGWKVASVHLASARTDPELMVCDLISNASHAGFTKLGHGAANDLRRVLHGFDFSLQIREDLARVDAWLADSALGFAIVHLAERLTDPTLDSTLRKGLDARVERAVELIARMGAPARNPQLEIVSSFLEETIRWVRDLERGERLVAWMSATLLPAIIRKLAEWGEEQELAWFAYSIYDRSLETSNHHGDLIGARQSLEHMSAHQGHMVQRWEHVDRFVQGQLHEAVHLTDARNFESARDKALRVADFYEQVGSLFQAALPEHFNTGLRSRRRGEALGTALQAEAYRGLEAREAFDRARELSAKALDEFDQQADRKRQMQYRCQLETMAGAFEDARIWLARSLDLPDASSHLDICQAIANIPDRVGKGFHLLHWLRLGAFMSRANSSDDFHAFSIALQTRTLDEDDWLNHGTDHPRQAILRYRTETALKSNEVDTARSCLARLRKAVLPIGRKRAVLALQLFSCQTLVAHHLAQDSPSKALGLLDDTDSTKPGLRQILNKLQPTLGAFRLWAELLNRLEALVETAIQSRNPARNDLGPLARAVHQIVL